MLTVKVTGAEELRRNLAKLGKAFTRPLAEADLMVAVQPMVDAARANVPLGPPSIHLRDNVGAAPDPDGANAHRWIAAVKIGALKTPVIGEIFYGRFLELGTVKQSARPWLRPAYDRLRDVVVKRLASLTGGRVRAALGARNG